eukprot:m.798656 g.798656  ORF g.798656 m.798656 type:complete len:1691 (+) comp59262_c0_seq5:948-6020(+)
MTKKLLMTLGSARPKLTETMQRMAAASLAPSGKRRTSVLWLLCLDDESARAAAGSQSNMTASLALFWSSVKMWWLAVAALLCSASGGLVTVTLGVDSIGYPVATWSIGRLGFKGRYVKGILGTETQYSSQKRIIGPFDWQTTLIFATNVPSTATITLETHDSYILYDNTNCVTTFTVSPSRTGAWGDPKQCQTAYSVVFTPVNLCLSNNGGCSSLYTCQYLGDNLRSCLPIDDPCQTNNGGCGPGTCTYTAIGQRSCTCNSGYSLTTTNPSTCQSNNACLTNNGGCGANSTCASTGVFLRSCTCVATTWSANGMNCQAVTVCAPGTYQTTAPTPTSDRTCGSCPAGQSCSGGTSAPLACGSANLYSAGGLISCQPVSTGFYSTPEAQPAAARSAQTVCPAGSACANGIRTPCTAGSTFQPATGATSCLTCTSTCPTGTSKTANCAVTTDTVCTDTTPPTITLVGGLVELNVTTGVFKDPGYSAWDTRDGNITNSVRTTTNLTIGSLGSYTVTYAVSDAAGLSASAIRQLKVVDKIAPVVTLKGASIAFVPHGSAWAEPGATAMDNVDGNLTANLSQIIFAGSSQTNFSYWVMDKSGNNGSATRIVNFVASAVPIIRLNGNGLVQLEAANTTSLYADPGATAASELEGDVSSTIRISWSPSSVSVTRLGTYIGSYSATSKNGSLSAINVTRTVVVADTIAPVLQLNGDANVSVEYKSTYTDALASFYDNFDSFAVLSSRVARVSTVNTSAPLGTVMNVTFSLSDTSGNTAVSKIRTVTVVNTKIPTLLLYGSPSETVEAATTYVDAGAYYLDVYDGSVNVSTTSVVDMFPTTTPSTNTLAYAAKNSAGKSAYPIARTVIVVDTTPPTLTLLGNATMTVNYRSEFVDPGATAMDSLDGALQVNVTPSAGSNSTWTYGEYTLTYSASDKAGNAAPPVVRTVRVIDLNPPVMALSAVSFLIVEAARPYTLPTATSQDLLDGSLTAMIQRSLYYLPPLTVQAKFGVLPLTAAPNFAVTDLGNLDVYNVTQGPTRSISSGSVLFVRFTSRDSAGNTAVINQTISFVDKTAPTLLLLNPSANLTVSYQDPSPSFYNSWCVASDLNDGDLTDDIVIIVSDPQGNNGTLASLNTAAPLGTIYTLIFTVSDAAGNAAKPVTQKIRVVDDVPPVVEFEGNTTIVVDPGTRLNATHFNATAEDNYDGNITNKIQASGSALSSLEAGGVYHLTFSATDSAGNVGSASLTVNVTGTAASASSASSTGPIVGAVIGAFALIVIIAAAIWIAQRSRPGKPSQVMPANMMSSGTALVDVFRPDDAHKFKPWYHGFISREEAESRLSRAGMKEGQFLMRVKDAKAGIYTLSVASNARAFHFLMKFRDNKFVFNEISRPEWGNSFVATIDYMSSLKAEGLPCQLTEGVTCTSTVTSAPSSRRNSGGMDETSLDPRYAKFGVTSSTEDGYASTDGFGARYESPQGAISNEYDQPQSSSSDNDYNIPNSTTGLAVASYAQVNKSRGYEKPQRSLQNSSYESTEVQYELASTNAAHPEYALASKSTGDSVYYSTASSTPAKPPQQPAEGVYYSTASSSPAKPAGPTGDTYYALASQSGADQALYSPTYALASESGTGQPTYALPGASATSQTRSDTMQSGYYALASLSNTNATYAAAFESSTEVEGFRFDDREEVDASVGSTRNGYIQIESM